MLLERAEIAESVLGGEIKLDSPHVGCLVWSDSSDNFGFTQAIVHSKFGVLSAPSGLRIFGALERYPESKAETGMYSYISCTRRVYMDKLLQRLLDNDGLVEFGAGPAILDVPILPYRALEETVGYRDYIGINKYFPDVSVESMYNMYRCAYKQFELFPRELQSKLFWYWRTLSNTVDVYKRLSRLARV